MNCTKQEFVAEIKRRQEARAAERDAKRAIEEATETPYAPPYLMSNISFTKYQGKYRTPKGFEC